MFSPRRFLFAALTLGLSACQVEVAGIEPIDIVGRPGLEPWYAKLIKPAPEEKPAAAPPPVPAAEPAPEPEIGAMGPYLRPPVFPALKMPPTVDAAAVHRLADDPIAVRFALACYLATEGLAPPEEIAARFKTNKGALLPLTEAQAPAAGLDRPLPPVEGMIARMRALASDRGRGTPATRASERTWLLDTILPLHPAARVPLAPPDAPAGWLALARLDRLLGAGLISGIERDAEAGVLEAQLESGQLAPPAPPPPPEVPKPAKPKHAAPKRGFNPGITPTPKKAELPRLTPDYKGPAGVHLLSMAAADYGQRAFDALSKQFPELAPLSWKAIKADLGELGVTYRLIAGPLDAAGAEKLCESLRTQGQSCTATPMPP